MQRAISSFPDDTKYIVLENDGEVCAAKNEGLRQADTEFCLFFDSDDVALPEFTDWLLQPANFTDVVYATAIYTDEDLNEIDRKLAQPFCGHRLQAQNFIPGSSLVRREKALEVGGFNPEFKILEDWDLWVRMHRAGARFTPAPEAKFLYRQHEHSRNRDFESRDELIALRRKIVGEPDPIDDLQATFYAQSTPATYYVRCQLPSRYLPGQVIRGPVGFFLSDEDGKVTLDGHHGKAAIFQFAASKWEALAVEHAKVNGTRVLIEADDNYLINPGKDIIKRSGWSLKVGDATYSREGHQKIAKRADGIVVTSKWLANSYRKINPNVYVCPNGVDPPDWPEPKKPDDGILRILWTASRSHDVDIPLITRAFDWASRQKDVEVYVAADFNPGWRFRYGYLPWIPDLGAYRSIFQNFDIGVAPVREIPYALARSDLKPLEYSMGAMASVVSDVPPYDTWADGENCLKAADAKGFYQQIRRLVENRDEVKQLAQTARSYVLKERTAEAQVHYWKEAIEG